MSLEFPKVDLSGVNEAMKNLNASLEKFAEDIQKRKDNAMAMAFTRHICDLLSENGVVVEVTEIEQTRNSENRFEAEYGFAFTGLDFSEHDKKVAEEKDKKIAELERDLNRLTDDLKKRVGEIYGLREENAELDHMRKSWMETAEKWSELNSEIQDKIANLECSSKIMSELEDLHQSDCIEINRLHTALEVMTEKYMKLREVHGLG